MDPLRLPLNPAPCTFKIDTCGKILGLISITKCKMTESKIYSINIVIVDLKNSNVFEFSVFKRTERRNIIYVADLNKAEIRL